MRRSPSSVLFACTLNSIRSPMAEAIGKHLFGHRIYFGSVGVKAEPINPFVVQVIDEIGIDLSRHEPKSFDDLEDYSFDVIVTLSPEAHHRAIELTRTIAAEVEFWHTFDPSLVQGSREVVLDAFREVRDGLTRRIKARFGSGPQGSV